MYKAAIKIVEVGPRDGLQNIKKFIPTNKKIELINLLSQTGLKNIQVTSFVSPNWIPQFKDNKEVFNNIRKINNINYSVLVPNEIGLNNALNCGSKEIEIFTSASEAFCRSNLNCDIKETFERFIKLIPIAKQNNIRIRGTVSCCFDDPFSGHVNMFNVVYVAIQLYKLGCDEIVLADTTGTATPDRVDSLTRLIKNVIPIEKIAYHFHDTHKRAIPNIYAALQHNVRIFDSSIGGLGGCPYAKNATGNVATEKVVHFLKSQNYYTGINLDKLNDIVLLINKINKNFD